MKVILLADIKNVGKKDQLLDVSEGYANNFLLKKGLALLANDKNLNLLKQKKGAEAAKEARDKQAAQDLAKEIKGKTFTLKMKAGEGGKLYGALTAADVAACLDKADYKVDKRNIVLSGNIKSVGQMTCKLKLYHEVSADITINIEAL
ncbi:50S ribosomal protein L9 [Amygdalobacter nucleatus]|uniref:Large ribosomal subunit protein bL9 n=1 Tax=Amygdalobacter nucleatus TaxID=3029274 RepID=A0A133YGY0_9FIRM|nr:50S ribosomal protein L9 [Amygdalobacter nucleatus]KXB42440.1 ribosomal protein L9 [Amygdalobacter nucleatus]MDF0486014.1 50S ribosomal protein L9 [Amygdalobacter nucleatus]WEG37429.1 50S ribosomal protein L9 [Amygdalobacter nucleatus]